MSIIRFATEKIKIFARHVPAQVLFVFLAFALMVVVSYFFAGQIIRDNLIVSVQEALMYKEMAVDADLKEPVTLVKSVSQTIRRMILQGFYQVGIRDYMADMSEYVITADNSRLINETGVYGYFDVFNGIFLVGTAWDVPEDFNPQERPWYIAAVEADGEVAQSPHYTDAVSGKSVFAYSRRIFDTSGTPLGIVCIDVNVDEIGEFIVDTRLTTGGYGIMLDDKLEILAHPDPSYIGLNLRDKDGALADKLISDGGVSEYKCKNYTEESSIAFFKQISNGWYIGMMTPSYEYYRELNVMLIFLIILGIISATMLSIVLVYINTAKNISDMKNQQKSNFLATMSHEIRTPLNAILGITEIQLQNEKIEKHMREAWGKVYNSGYVLLNIINDILDLSKIEAGKLELYNAKYEISSLINDIVHLNIMRIDSKPLIFKLELGENIPAEMIGDELRIKQILNNMLSNAFKYTESGEVILSVLTKEGLPENGGRNGGEKNITLVFKVSDTGQGMTEEQLKNLFSEYMRYNMEANRQVQGTGLGLSISKNLAEKMNGKISVKSEIGKGTEFTVRLPQVDTGNGILSKELAENLKNFKVLDVMQNKQTRIVQRPIPNGRVLVVDDMETNLHVTKGLLSPYRLTIETVLSGFEAIEKITEGTRYDIIFMDHMMPKMDGIETTQIIRELGYTHPVVALTANAVSGTMEMFLNNGFDDFISKPIDTRLLNAVLNRFIKSKDTNAEDEIGNNIINAELAKIFTQDAERAIAEIEELADYADEENMQTYVINVHAMKSALANIGEMKLSKFALKLEEAGRAYEASVIAKETPIFMKELRELMCKLAPSEEKENDVAEENSEYIREKLLEIKKACENYDIIVAKAELNELKQSARAGSTQKIIDAIAKHLLHSDFEEAAAIAEQAVISRY